mmetsp:Transcript_4335/g.4486  ORF Transcript_4335/g.4486 Transcript_4335/m.4486 type:complete len:517 (+) Transcript_4335:381-1931(+)|eukprot:CAMPEP_0119041082 /NCGR_PEP_ID=MMETSP1177-20130426/11210_1 /TAXON_ID=2985 /ORGANISM="Ochromonas sp, Strain CCMP1899" /LENGTH=516 /DNA_ID=CAMNT_0007006773 /DNA_START=362 /DNA_END=1912 /DNA_ORIENTATION=-
MNENDIDEDAFITSVPTKFSSFKSKKRSGNDKLNNVRKDHTQLMDIVKKFGSKVSTMVDKQRAEYMLAYENHMQDVQKELYLLREKVQEIATDSTRDEKIKSLELAQTKYKAESITLDEQNNEMRKKLKALTVSMQSTERDRDWLLARLRTAKKKYKRLETVYDVEKHKFDSLEGSEFFNSSIDMSQSQSQESSILRDLYKHKDKKNRLKPIPQGPGPGQGLGYTAPSSSQFKPGNWRGRLAAEVAVNRADPLVGTGVGTGPGSYDRDTDRDTDLRAVASAPNLPRRDSYAFQNNYQPQNQASQFKSAAEKNDLALLVAMRARREGLRSVIDRCLQSCVKDQEITPQAGSNTQDRSYSPSLPELAVVCMKFIESCYENQNDIDKDDRRRQLAALLATHPQTFVAISDILAGKFSSQNDESQSHSLHNEGENKAMNDIMNFNSSKWLDNMDIDNSLIEGSKKHEKPLDRRDGLMSDNRFTGDDGFDDSLADSKVDDAFGNERVEEEEEGEGNDDDDE